MITIINGSYKEKYLNKIFKIKSKLNELTDKRKEKDSLIFSNKQCTSLKTNYNKKI